MSSKHQLSQKEQIERAFASFFETMKEIQTMNSRLLKEMHTVLDQQRIQILKKSSKLG